MNNIIKGSTDFNRVRDGRNAPDAYFDIDLTNAGDQFFNVAGNSFYIDANPSDGNAVVYFQETDKLRGPTPFYVSPGFIARIPFTQVRITNVSQPGKKIRVVYGVDTDFQPGSVSQVSFAGEVTVNDVIATNVESVYASGVSGIGFTATPLLAPAANLNGLNLKSATVGAVSSAGGVTIASLIAAPSAPATIFGAQRINIAMMRGSNTTFGQHCESNMARVIPAGWGLYSVNESTTAAGGFHVLASFQLL